MRIRIALTTAVAVFIAIPTVILTLFSSTSAASTRTTRLETVAAHRGASAARVVRISEKLMSYSEERAVAQPATYADAVQSAKETTFFNDLTFFKNMAFFQAVAQQQAGSIATMPAAWVPTALCEESGRDDPYAGFFGILEWNHFDGYPTAGSAPLSVQLAWEAAHGQGPPDAPGQCHGY